MQFFLKKYQLFLAVLLCKKDCLFLSFLTVTVSFLAVLLYWLNYLTDEQLNREEFV